MGKSTRVPTVAAMAGMAFIALLLSSAQKAPGGRHAVLLISIDGMRPDYVTEADKHQLKIPHLRKIMQTGAYAAGVRGVLPTVTYPSHTTILTGVSPARHGIYANTTFDPLNKNQGGWYWYSQDIRVPTLPEAAQHAGLSTATVSWPVTVAARGVQYLIPEYWRASTGDDLKLLSALSTPGLMAHLAEESGPYLTNLNEALPGDRARTKYAVNILRENHPDLIAVHLAALDHLEHETGPFSKESNETLEQIDGMVGELEDAMRTGHPNAAICVVSDHGFTTVDHHLHLLQAFVSANLVQVDEKARSGPDSRITDWRAVPWVSGGSAAIMLEDPADNPLRDQVRSLLNKLATDDENGIAAVLDEAAIAKLGGAATASFWVTMKSNFAIDTRLKEPLAEAVKIGGTHGYSPENPDLLASFFIAGPGISSGLNLHEIDMRSEAPTLAKYLGFSLLSAEKPALSISSP